MDLFKNKKTQILEKINTGLRTPFNNTEELLVNLVSFYGFESGVVHLIDGKFLKRYVSFNIKDDAYKDERIEITESPCQLVINAIGNVVLTNEHEKILSSFRLSKVLQSTSYIGVPLFSSEEKFLGTIALFSKNNTPVKDLNTAYILAAKISHNIEIDNLKKIIATLGKKIEAIANRDPLTGLLNRAMLLDKLEEEFSRAKRYERHLSCIMIAVENYEKIQEQYGTHIANFFIKKSAQLLKDSLRTVDYIFRYGDNEFFIILPETNIQDSFVLAERLKYEIQNYQYNLEKNFETHDENKELMSIKPKINIGISSFPHTGVTSSFELIQMSDTVRSQNKYNLDQQVN